MNSTTMSTSSSSLNDQTPLYARRAHPSSPPSSFGQAQDRCATAAPTLVHNNSEISRYTPFGYSTPTTESPAASLITRRPPPPPPAFLQMRSGSRQGTLPPPSRHSGPPAPSSDPQATRFIASSQPSPPGSNSGQSRQPHSTTDKRDLDMGLFEGAFSSEDLQLNQAFTRSTLPTPNKGLRPAYHYTPSTTASPTMASRDKIRERDPTLQPLSRTPSQPSFNPTGVGGVRPVNKVPMSIAGTRSSSNSRSGGCSQSVSTRDSILSSEFYAPSVVASTPDTELSASGTGLGADPKWLAGVGYQARSFSKAAGSNADSGPAALHGNGDVIMVGTARSGHWVNHLVIRTRREHITGGCAPHADFWCIAPVATIFPQVGIMWTLTWMFPTMRPR